VSDPAPPAASTSCASCGEPLVEGARFCEACGAAANGGAPGDAGAPAAPTAGASSDDDPTLDTSLDFSSEVVACDKCGGEVADDGYCTVCGHRALEPVTVVDGGDLALATHRGRRHHRNEDSGALAVTAEGWPVLVVSDGVSISPNPHLASRAAVDAAVARLGGRPFGGPDDLVAAVADAHVAASAVPNDTDPQWTFDGTHPACTIVVAVATPGEVHMANVGDARGYVVRRAPAAGGGTGAADAWSVEQVTVDDSVAAQAVAQGVAVEVALNLPGGHAITAWLGGDARDVAAHVSSTRAAAGDLVLVCSDGLWNYAPTDQAIGGLVSAALPAPGGDIPLATVCEHLVDWANEQGGADNICVTLAPVPDVGDGSTSEVTTQPTESEEDV
jgi:serine/threonine protein phosphatase PrpC